MPRAGLDTPAVVRAARGLADADGLETLTLARLARRLGVRSPSLYAHVAGLADLRGRIALEGISELADRLTAAAAGRAGADALRAVADAYRAFAEGSPGAYAAIQRAPTADEPERGRAAATLVDTLAATLRGYGLEGDDAVHGVRIVRSALHGFVALRAAGGFGMPLDLEVTWERLVVGLDAALVSLA